MFFCPSVKQGSTSYPSVCSDEYRIQLDHRLPLFIQIPLYKYTCKALCTSFDHTVVAVLHKDRHRIVWGGAKREFIYILGAY